MTAEVGLIRLVQQADWTHLSLMVGVVAPEVGKEAAKAARNFLHRLNP